ncbi:hypothetical protein [Halomicronema sp. CCY15110]|uniref:hypothetical protein n=1 Tax=Halomicronema sp. CCY15110 TaxID=2767773 RepID=UPI00194E7236|nr:hypothetical protein [Halomicronema sp. CCY15110]
MGFNEDNIKKILQAVHESSGSTEELSSLTGMEPDLVNRYLHSLEKDGYVEGQKVYRFNHHSSEEYVNSLLTIIRYGDF